MHVRKVFRQSFTRNRFVLITRGNRWNDTISLSGKYMDNELWFGSYTKMSNDFFQSSNVIKIESKSFEIILFSVVSRKDRISGSVMVNHPSILGWFTASLAHVFATKKSRSYFTKEITWSHGFLPYILKLDTLLMIPSRYYRLIIDSHYLKCQAVFRWKEILYILWFLFYPLYPKHIILKLSLLIVL